MMSKPYTVATFFLLAACGTAAADEVKGTITRVNPEKKELVIDVRSRSARGTSMSFSLAADGKVSISHRAAGMGDLKTGEKVRVYFDLRDGKRVAYRISAHGPAPAAATAPAAPAGADTVGGVLRRVAVTEREIVVIGPGARGAETETTLAVPEDVRVTRGQKAVKFEDLKEDDAVVVRVEKRKDRMTAVAINVGKEAPAPAPQPPNQEAGKLLRALERVLEKPAAKPQPKP